MPIKCTNPAMILLLVVILGACNAIDTKIDSEVKRPSSPTLEAQHADGVRRVTTAELDELMKQGKVVVVDVRSRDSYDTGHIRGAKLIPVGEIGERANELPRDKMIVTYCS